MHRATGGWPRERRGTSSSRARFFEYPENPDSLRRFFSSSSCPLLRLVAGRAGRGACEAATNEEAIHRASPGNPPRNPLGTPRGTRRVRPRNRGKAPAEGGRRVRDRQSPGARDPRYWRCGSGWVVFTTTVQTGLEPAPARYGGEGETDLWARRPRQASARLVDGAGGLHPLPAKHGSPRDHEGRDGRGY